MEIKRLEEIKEPLKKAVLTIGNFDGVHLGHQKIIKEVVSEAKKIKGQSVVMTFDPHPVRFFHPDKEFHLLTLCDEKAKIIEKLGVDILLCVRFNNELASLEPEEFIKAILVDKIGAKAVIIGRDYRFGKARKGDIKLLRKESKRYGFTVKVVNPVKIKGETISSTKIRNLILKGDVKKASAFLGRPYSIEGIVVKGTGRGASILGFPTANILSGAELIPQDGVYAVKVRIEEFSKERAEARSPKRRGFSEVTEESLFDGVMNIGKNPTFGNKERTLEVHILDFNGDIMHKTIKVYFIERLRKEKRFPSPEALRKAIKKDIEEAKEILSQRVSL